jgi:hypothetical protein
MTTTEVRRGGSAFPPSVAELLPRARELARELGGLPSRNRLMRELRVGANKAAVVLAELAEPDTSTPAGVVRELRPAPPAAAAAAAVTQPTRPTPPATEQRADDAAGSPDADAGPATGVRVSQRTGRDRSGRPPVRSWPVLLVALSAFVAIWSGWVGLGELTGFGPVRLLPGIADGFTINTAITLPLGMEAYAAYALRAALSSAAPRRARRFARRSVWVALALGAAGQAAYHLMSAAGMTSAPWQITTVVACLPVGVLGLAAALAHLLRESESESEPETREVSR